MGSRRQRRIHIDWNRINASKTSTLIFFIVFSSIGFYNNKLYSQKSEFELAEKYLQEFKNDSAQFILESINLSTLDKAEEAHFYFLKGELNFSKSAHDAAFADFIEARRRYSELNDSCNLSKATLMIIEVLSHQPHNLIPTQPFLDEFILTSIQCGKPIDEAIAYSKLAVVYLKAENADKAIENFNKAISIATKLGDTSLSTNLMFNKGVVYNTTLKKFDSALYFFKYTAPYYIKNDSQEYLSYNYNNQAEAYKKKGDYETAIKFYRKADSIPLRKFSLKTKRIFYKNIADVYHKAGQYDSAYFYSQKLLNINDSINEVSQNINMAEIKEQYDNEKLRADKLELEAKQTQHRNIALGLGGGLLGVSIIGFLLVKNTRKKQRIAEQQREIEIRKTEKILKEQELATIDAMIAGQEKERERLAGELHDSVVATLAAARLQFEHLKKNKDVINNASEIYEKTSSLLEDAYTEIRSMAHLKNSGVIAKNGLLPAIKKLVRNTSGTNDLTIELNYFGLNDRLENSLEITIFRVIQELVTNIIKHSEATYAHISITQLKETLSIIVEDNGKGFKYNPLKSNAGMGLAHIERRIELLEGTMEIDSTINKGTTILIDIPL